tara:strand:+ start:348 stop:1082 length:735 start_codon:yes stop_codon:yes gene_type:complete
MAYTQQAGRPKVESAAVNYLTDKDKKDPAPNGVVASNSDITFGSGVTNELDTVMLTGTNTKKKVDRPKSLRNSILDNTADDSYSMYGEGVNKATTTVVDPTSGSNREQTTFSSNKVPNYSASITSGNNSVSTSSSRYPSKSVMHSNSPFAETASNFTGITPANRQDGFQKTYTDKNFVRDTKTGLQISRIPSSLNRPSKPSEIKTYKKHLKDSTDSRTVRLKSQVYNNSMLERSNLIKEMIKKS